MALLLDYGFSTAPGPLQASTATANSPGRVNVSVSDPTDTVYCNQLLIAVPLGEEAAALALTTNVPVGSINTSTWSLVSTEVGDLPWDDAGLTWAKYTFSAVSADPNDWKIGTANLVPSLLAIVNRVPGEFTYAIQETSGTEPSKLAPNTGKFALQKVMPYFYAHNLVAVGPKAPGVPKTEFASGEPVLLEWEGNGTWYELFERGQPQPLYAGTAPHFEIPAGKLQTDTTIVLVASTTGNPSQDKPTTGYETVVLYDSITLTVSNPALTGKSLNVSEGVTAKGTIQGEELSGSYVYVDAGEANALEVSNSSNTYYVAAFNNPTPHTANYITGVCSMVGGSGDSGFGTNGKYVTAAGSAVLTHLETRSGHRVVTSPLVLQEEVQISGSGQLAGGRATVQLDPEAADLIVHGNGDTYRVLLTPTGRCGGLAVVEKTAEGFAVEELADGAGDAEFDWLLISRKRAAVESVEPSSLPDQLPQPAEPQPAA
ncbi:MAG TPA: hypothetical protein VFI03_02130 [Solirubrobacterales bacterium]|nr:hypothetical protein [Solirubrobacterales bacterium]